MAYTLSDYQRSADYLRSRIGSRKPEVALMLGSGLGFLADEVKNPISVPYQNIPGFRRSTAPGHAGRFVFGELSDRQVAVMDGRFHTYEGYDAQDVAYPVRALRLLGVGTLVLTNAAGAVNTAFAPGEIMLLTDHIKLFGASPLAGPNLDAFGPRFPDSTHIYTPALLTAARDAARELKLTLREGVYMFFPGPQYETPAEIRAARILGADAVGMSTVPESLTAAHCGMRVLGLSLLANMAAGVLDQPLTGQEIIDCAEKMKAPFSALVLKCLEKM